MTIAQTTRIHPLMAVAAVSLTLVSLVGAASIAGLLPNSHATPDTTPVAASVAPSAQAMNAQPLAAQAPQQTRPAVVEHRTVVHHRDAPARNVGHADYSAQAAPVAQAPAPAPVAQNSPLGMGIGAVVGGLIGNQVGGGKGKTAATIAGVVGGAYVGNEIAKKN